MSPLWDKCLEIIEKQVLPENFNTWLSPAKPFAWEENNLTLSVPNEFFKKYLEENYQSLIEISLESVCNNKVSVDFLVRPSNMDPAETSGECDIEKVPSPVISVQQKETPYSETHLNPKYSFKNFVVGSCNQFAHAASEAVALNPELAYNPLFIYGSVGLGKTHLLHAIGNAIIEKNPYAKILYISAEGFTIDLIQSLKNDQMNCFRERYRPLDVLLIDDIQFLAGKDRTQEEFFYTFNALYESHKQVILTSDTFPREMTNIKERLRSRFESGLISDMKPPDLETKVAILYKKCELYNLAIPQEVAIYVAGNIRFNVRELEGLLLRLIAYSSFSNKKIDMELTKEVLKEFAQSKSRVFKIPDIIRVVSEYFSIKPSDIKSKKRSREISIPRQIAMYISREHTKASLPEIGREFGGKDHTTVIYSHNKISNNLNKNKVLSSDIHKIVKKLDSE